VAESKKEKSRFLAFLTRHVTAFGYILREVVPVILRSGRRPVIFSRYTGMGDIICTVGPSRELMKRHPGATFIYNCHPDFADVPRLAGIADKITTFGPIGLVGHWYRFLLGGFYHFAHGDDLPDNGCNEPMAVEFCRQFGLPVNEEHPDIPMPPVVRETATAILKEKNLDVTNLVLIHPGPSWPVREWPVENWTQLIAALRARGFNHIAQLGVSRYMNFGQVDVPSIPGTVSLINRLSVSECFAVIAQAKLFIGIDSGLLHIAATVRTPSVGLFGMTLPEMRFSKNFQKDFVVNRIECAGCEHRKPRLHWVTGCPYDIRCMKTLPVETVLAATLKVLEKKGPAC
jgi:ADP-heptose:LPS heptosyltransferase